MLKCGTDMMLDEEIDGKIIGLEGDNWVEILINVDLTGREAWSRKLRETGYDMFFQEFLIKGWIQEC